MKELDKSMRQTYVNQATAQVGIGSAVAYPFGVVIVILAVNFLSVIFRFDVEEEKRRQGVATGLLDLLFRIVGKSGEIYPVSALFEPSLEESLYGFFMAYSKMETTYSHDRFYVLPREIRGIKIPGTGTKDTLPGVDRRG